MQNKYMVLLLNAIKEKNSLVKYNEMFGYNLFISDLVNISNNDVIDIINCNDEKEFLLKLHLILSDITIDNDDYSILLRLDNYRNLDNVFKYINIIDKNSDNFIDYIRMVSVISDSNKISVFDRLVNCKQLMEKEDSYNVISKIMSFSDSGVLNCLSCFATSNFILDNDYAIILELLASKIDSENSVFISELAYCSDFINHPDFLKLLNKILKAEESFQVLNLVKVLKNPQFLERKDMNNIFDIIFYCENSMVCSYLSNMGLNEELLKKENAYEYFDFVDTVDEISDAYNVYRVASNSNLLRLRDDSLDFVKSSIVPNWNSNCGSVLLSSNEFLSRDDALDIYKMVLTIKKRDKSSWLERIITNQNMVFRDDLNEIASFLIKCKYSKSFDMITDIVNNSRFYDSNFKYILHDFTCVRKKSEYLNACIVYNEISSWYPPIVKEDNSTIKVSQLFKENIDDVISSLSEVSEDVELTNDLVINKTKIKRINE